MFVSVQSCTIVLQLTTPNHYDIGQLKVEAQKGGNTNQRIKTRMWFFADYTDSSKSKTVKKESLCTNLFY